MAVSLAQAALLSNDVLLKGIIETIIKESPILARMPFIEINGNALTYNRELTLAGMQWHAVNDTWTESAPTWAQKTASLTILGGDADVDNFIRATRSNIQDIEAAVVALKTKALIHEYEDKFIYGAGDNNEFNGLIELIDTDAASDQLIAAGATGATLTLAMVDQLIDAVLGGKPDMLLMSKRSRRKMTALMRAAGTFFETRDEFGSWIQTYNGIPILIDDWVLNTHTLSSSLETAYTGGACSTIYALQLGEGALAGLSSPGLIQVERLGNLETKDATRTRIKFYCGLALFNLKKAAALIGVKD